MNKLTTREKNLLLACIFFAFILVISMYVISPLWLNYEQEKDKIAGLNMQLAELKKFQQQSSKVNSDLAKIAELDKKLPNTAETAELLYYLKTAAGNKGAVLLEYSINTKDDVSEQSNKDGESASGLIPVVGRKVLNYNIKVAGSNESLSAFLQELEGLTRIVWVQKGLINKIDPNNGTSNNGPLEAEFEIESYYLPQSRPYLNNVVPKPLIRGRINPF